MNCPYCGNEMELGVIESSEPINWLRKERAINQPNLKNGELSLVKPRLARRAKVDAWLCRSCRRIVIDC